MTPEDAPRGYGPKNPEVKIAGSGFNEFGFRGTGPGSRFGVRASSSAPFTAKT